MSLKRAIDNFAIRTKFAVAFVIILSLVGGLGLAATLSLRTLDRTVDELTGNSMVSITELGQMRESLLRYRLAMSTYVAGRNLTPAFDQAIEGAARAFDKHDARYAPTVVPGEETSLHNAVVTGWQSYLNTAAPAIAAYHAGKTDDAWGIYVDKGGRVQGEALDHALGQLVDFNTNEADRITKQADQEYQRGYWIVVGLLIAAASFALVVGYLMVRSIAHPIVRCSGVLNGLANRDYDFELQLSGRSDEIGVLSRAIGSLRQALQDADRMAAEQESAQGARARRQAAMERHTQDFGQSASGVMTVLAAAAERMRHAAEAMSEATSAVAGEAATTSSGAAQASQDLNAVAAAVEELNASVGEISRQLAEATMVAQQAVRRADTSHATMQDLSEATARIGDIVHLINNIANQTNLLALNATIESARAGEAGKGFAVVAGEVKTLAAQTAKATSEIASQIETVRGATGEAVSAMADISQIIAKINEVSAAIAAAVEQQSATTREIAKSVQAVANSSAGTTQAMEHVVSVSGNAGTVSRDVLAGAADIGREAATLRTEVDQFLAAVRDESPEDRRRYERFAVSGATAGVQADGHHVVRVQIRNISRGGAALASDLALRSGAALQVDLPNAGSPIAARVVRSGGGELNIVFSSEPKALTQIDRALDALTKGRQAA